MKSAHRTFINTDTSNESTQYLLTATYNEEEGVSEHLKPAIGIFLQYKIEEKDEAALLQNTNIKAVFLSGMIM